MTKKISLDARQQALLEQASTLIENDAFAGAESEESSDRGMAGEYSIESLDGRYSLAALISAKNPDCSDDELREKCYLTITLKDRTNSTELQVDIDDYCCLHEYLGDYLADDLGPEGLLELLLNELSAA